MSRRPADPARPKDAGSLTVFVAVIAVALLAVAGLVVDGAAKLRAARQATSLAEAAARAGADSVDAAAARAGQVGVINTPAAVAAARAYLAAADVHGQVHRDGPAQISVDVQVRQPTVMLSLVGVDTFTVAGHATAELRTGG